MKNAKYHDGNKNIIINVVESQSDAPLERMRVSIFIGKYLLESGYSNNDGYYMSSLVSAGHYTIKVHNERDGSKKTAFVRLPEKTPVARKKIKLRINLKREKRKNNSGWNFDDDNWRSKTGKKNDASMFFFSSNTTHKSKNFSGKSSAKASSGGSFATWLHSKQGATAFIASVIVIVVAISLILTFTLRGGQSLQFVLPDGSALLLEYDQNGKFKHPSAPATDDAHGFDGWYLDAEGKIPFDPNSPSFSSEKGDAIVVYPVFHKHIYHNENGMTAWEEISTPTCVDVGSRKAKCLHTNCKKEIFETIEVDLGSHVMSVVPQYYDNTYGVKCLNKGCPHNIDMSTKGLTFELNAARTGYFVSSKGTATDTDIIIPPTYNDPNDPEASLAVVGIKKAAYAMNNQITSVKVPSSVTTIGEYAFTDCTNLITINFAKESQLATIGSYAFDSCESLTNIEIPSSVTSFGAYAFTDCTNLTTIAVAKESRLTNIGAYAFAYCKRLTDIEIPSSVTTISRSAFEYCNNLAKITFAKGSQLTNLGDYAFAYCESLTAIEIPSSVTTISTSPFADCTNLTTITFAKGSQLTNIGAYAFDSYESLTDIEIPSSVTSIGAYAFTDCTNLAKITFAKGSQLTNIGAFAFAYCESLTDIEIPSSVTTIGAYAFTDCTNLAEITFAEDNKLATMGSYVVASCTSLTTISYKKTMAAWYKASKNHIYNEQTNSTFAIFCSDGILTKHSTF